MIIQLLPEYYVYFLIQVEECFYINFGMCIALFLKNQYSYSITSHVTLLNATNMLYTCQFLA